MISKINKWITTRFGGLARFNSKLNSWTNYTSINPGFPENYLLFVSIDKINSVFVSSASTGIYRYKDTIWTYFNTSNSNLPNNHVNQISIDGNNNKWITTEGGIAIYNENGIVSIETSNSTPYNFLLYQNYPNPFNPKTKIKFDLKEVDFVSLKVYNFLGILVATMLDNKLNPGNYLVEFDGNFISSGIYFYQFKTSSSSITRKMILLK